MEIKIRNRKGVQTLNVTPIQQFEINPGLVEWYQNDLNIANVIMEKQTYKAVGCRFTALARLAQHRLANFYKAPKEKILDMPALDKLADQGGEKNDAWVDSSQGIYDIVNAPVLIDRISKYSQISLNYKIIPNNPSLKKEDIINIIKDNVGLVAKMLSLVSNSNNDFHFINVIGYVLTNDNLYLKLKETYKGYNGYDGFYTEWNVPIYFEEVK